MEDRALLREVCGLRKRFKGKCAGIGWPPVHAGELFL
jgi:hypothetical protein